MDFSQKKHGANSRSRQQFTADQGSEKSVMPPLGLLITDLLIAALLLIFPFVMGGREAWGHCILIMLSLALGFVWCFHQTISGGRFVLLRLEPLLIAGILLVWFQAQPQSPKVLSWLSPEYARLLPDWGTTQRPPASDAAAGGPVWRTASLTPAETRHAFHMALAYVLIGVVVTQRLQKSEDCHRLLKLVGISGLLMAVFAVCQLALSNGRFFWFYRHPYTGTGEILKGAFTNRNHFAQFLVLSIGPLIWWLMHEREVHSGSDNSTVRKGLGPAQGNHSNFDRTLNMRLLLLTLAVVGVLLCVVMTLSRGGMVAAAVTCAVSLAGLWKAAEIRSSLAMLFVAAGLAMVGVAIFSGEDGLELRVSQLASADAGQMDPNNARRTIWNADLDAIRVFPILGTGIGSHREVYPVYMEQLAEFASYEFSHAESSYVHLALETGLAGFGLLAMGLLYVIWRIGTGVFRSTVSPEYRGALTAVAASLAGGVLHAAADFIWYAPAIVVTTIILTAAGLRLRSGFSPEQGLPLPRIGWLAAAAGLGAMMLTVQPELQRRINGEKYWHQFLIASFDLNKDESEDQNDEQLASLEEDELQVPVDFKEDDESQPEPSVSDLSASGTAGPGEKTDASGIFGRAGAGSSDYRLTTASARRQDTIASLRHRMGLLIRSLQANPEQPRVQLILSSVSLKLFDILQETSDNPLSLIQIRDAVQTSEFENVVQVHEWLNRAFGPSVRLISLADRLARQSLKGCPIQGNAYLNLAETGFLRDPANQQQTAMIRQALLLREYDPHTRFVAGQDAVSRGDQAAAINHWAAVFHANSTYRRAITRILSSLVPISFILEQFQPDAVELGDVLDVCVATNRPSEETRQILTAIDQAVNKNDSRQGDSTSGEARINLLVAAAETAQKLNLLEQAESLLRKAIADDDSAYRPRRMLGNLLYQTERFAEAAQYYRWCYESDPGDERLEKLIRDARQRALPQRVPVRNASFGR